MKDPKLTKVMTQKISIAEWSVWIGLFRVKIKGYNIRPPMSGNRSQTQVIIR